VADAQGRLYVIESHTHSPPRNYAGPKRDLIKVFEGTRTDGRFAKAGVFADGIFQAQSIEIAPGGEIYVVCTREVLILHDRDGDGRSEGRTRILHLDPYEERGNPHGQMMGIAFSNDGWLYVATGTTSDDWISSDGERLVVGPYWGGIIARCRPDGSRLERVAWGFWNPFGMTFDRHGRLIAVDNDPDHRGPNRLLHIVEGGDYGFKKTYGRYGLHPYQAWEGELPGTLPMIAGIGEAPTAVIDANRAALPPDYRDTIIGSTWGEHNLTLYRPKPAGASIKASHEIFLKGLGHDEKESPFRPSGMAVSPADGSIYISDWMLIDYTTHQRGRIWRISPAPGVPVMPPRSPYAEQVPTPELARMLRLTDASQPGEYPRLLAALKEDDPFMRNAAVTALSRPAFRDAVIRDLEHEDSAIRLGALLALRRADIASPSRLIEPRLADPDIEVVRMAMIWAGEKELRSLSERIEATASMPNLSKPFFQTWLATMQIMQHRDPTRPLRPEFLEKLAHDETRPLLLRAMAIRWLTGIERAGNHDFLVRAARRSDPVIRVEAVRRLAESTDPQAASVLREIAMDRRSPAAMRVEALASLAAHSDASLLPLLNDPDPEVRLETARTLRAIRTNPTVKAAATKKLEAIRDDSKERKLKSQLEFLLAPEEVSRPATVRGWQQLLATGGDPEAGRRVFFSANSACSACHISEGRGVKLGTAGGAGFIALSIGPDLSVIGRTADRDAMIHSIVRPSDSIAPEYQGWFVKMKSGEMHTGREIDQEDGAIQLIMLDGHEHDFSEQEIAGWGAMENSLMPDGLAEGLAVEEFRDLVAYLESLR
jgi:putative membrane-bound dehydrogenase-like protein